MVEPRGWADDGLRDRVREVHALVEPDVALRDRGLPALADDDQVPRVGDRGRGVERGDEQDVDWMLDDRAPRDLDERAVLQEGGVERDERVRVDLRVSPEVGLDDPRVP